MAREEVISAFENQRDYCVSNDAPITAAICAGLVEALDENTTTGLRVLSWGGKPLPDALPLRLAGGLHHLYLNGEAPELEHIYRGRETESDFTADKLRTVMERCDVRLLPWLDGPPQTNEAGRSATYIAGLHWLAHRTKASRIEGLEIGSSAGMNLLVPHYHYNLDGMESGLKTSPVSIQPEWRGDSPPDAPFVFESMRGSDIRPLDLTEDAVFEKLRAYIWPDHPQRVARMEAARTLYLEQPPQLEQAEAADWVEARLAEPQEDGVCRVLMHSIVWQYLPDMSKDRITEAMEKAGAAATTEKPLAWIALEANRSNFRHELTVRYWPGDGETHHLADAHPHGFWVEWMG